MIALLLILAVLALIALNAFFVAAEFALVRARSDRLDALGDEGVRGAICVACTFTRANSAATKNAFSARQSIDATRATTDQKQDEIRVSDAPRAC